MCCRGVDLRMTATVEGHREVLVAKTPAEAADLRVRRVRFGMSSHDLTARSAAGGGTIRLVKPVEDGRHDGSGSVAADDGALCGC
jgi:hypothetical protein